MDHVAGHDVSILGEVDLAVLELGGVVRVDDRGRDLRHPADPVDAVGAFDDRRRRPAGCREERGGERLVDLAVVLPDPTEVTGLWGGRTVGRDRPRDLVPGLATLQVGQRRVGLRLGGGLLGGRRLHRTGVRLRLDLDDPGVARLRRGGLGDEPGVDVRVGVGDAFLGREGCLEFRIDDTLEGDRGDLLLLLLDDLELRFGLGVGKVSGKLLRADPALGLAEPPALDRVAVEELVLGDRLAVDAADRGEVFVVPGQSGGDDEDDDGDNDDDAEAEVHVEAAAILALPRRTVGALADWFGSKCHLT